MNLPKGPYNPNETEKEMLDYWLSNKFYSPEYKSSDKLSTAHLSPEALEGDTRETYTNILPPPNANGNLHLGHMSGYAYQDLMGRYNRMQGKKVLLLPGKDHAGIQTEVVYEKELKSKGIDKKELGREEFYKQCFDFCMEHSKVARQQEKNLGLSADFDRELFTLDPKVVDEVLQTFIDMYDDELLSRKKRLINWCVRCQSALADIDTEYKDSMGKFFYFKYGFTTPDEYAIHVKNTYGGKEVEAVVERYKDMEYTDKKGETFDWKFNYYGRLEGEICPGDDMDLDVLFVGYEDGTKPEEKLTGNAIGIMMRLDRDFKLIIANPEATEEQIESELDAIYEEFSKYFAGTHIIKFAEYPEDKFYTNGFILATSRPETKFGDTAVCVHPDDKRYAEWVGKEVEVLTLSGPAKIKVIADRAIDPEFGTGIMKVTPAHAPEDWDIAMRHPEVMPEKQVINFDGKLNHLTGKYEGMTVKEAREAMIPDMKEIGMLIKLNEKYENRKQVCERCKHQIEPLISYQWFVNTKPLKEAAKKLVTDGKTNIMPEGKQNVYMNWMDNPEDWCITRQLWWGYRVPVWYKQQPEEYITETGEVKEKVGDKVMESMEDYAEMMKVQTECPGINLTIVRHGEAEHNANGTIGGQINTKLTDNGRKEAKNAAQKFIGTKFDAVICSDLARTTETAEIITKELGLSITEKSELLRERNYGELQGKTKKEAIEDYGEQYWAEVIEGAETIEEIRQRINKVVTHIKDNYPNAKNILIVTHGGFQEQMSRVLKNQELKSMITCQHINATIPQEGWIQDEDVLDTWFSSGQWPALTLLARDGDFDEFYSTQVMETGWDILIFWVTRMMLLCPYKAEKVLSSRTPIRDLNEEEIPDQVRKDKNNGAGLTPFKDVYLHGLVLDKNGVKMSKSKGNGIDPFEMMQKYGTDALRLSFVVGNKVGQNYRLYEEKIESFRNYCNKIWNVSKFALMNIDKADFDIAALNKADLKFEEEDLEMLKHVEELVKDSTTRMNGFNFGVAAQQLYESIWHTFADIYLENTKQRIYTKDREGNEINTSEEAKESRKAALWTLWYSLDKYLRLLHPFIPFITERIWKEIPKVDGESTTIMYAKWPE